MTNFDYAVQYSLENEGVLSNDRNDRGGLTKYGITWDTLRAYQNKYPGSLRGRDVASLTRDDAITIYRALYWRYDDLTSRRIATKLFDLGINFGLTEAVRIAQNACRATGGLLIEADGLWGPATRAALNSGSQYPAGRLLLFKGMVLFAGKRYVDIALADHSQIDFIDGWLARAAKRPLD